jgi:hypothetical protein
MHSVTTHWIKDGSPLAWLSKSTSVPAADAEDPVTIRTGTRSVKKCTGTDQERSVNCGFDGYLNIVRKYRAEDRGSSKAASRDTPTVKEDASSLRTKDYFMF